MSDLIDRDAAINRIRQEIELYTKYPPFGDPHVLGLSVAAMLLENYVPSAQPNLQQTCNKLATDCISRQALRSAMYHEAFDKDTEDQRWDSGCWIRYRMFERIIDSMPSATPEIVSCEACRHWVTVVDREKAEYGLCSGLKAPIGTTPRDGYCYRAERRSEHE